MNIQALTAKYPALAQGGKFIVTGLINTAIDFVVLFLLIYVTKKNIGIYTLIFPAISFAVATTNSFFMNKHWTFKKEGGESEGAKDFGQFIVITLGGLAINSGITYSLSNFLPPFLGIPLRFLSPDKLQTFWVLFSKACATALSLVWNFVGYKFWVFKK